MRRLLILGALAAAAGCRDDAPVPAVKNPPAQAVDKAPASKNVILFLGDSLTAGYGLPPEQAYPALLSELWRKKNLPFVARNAGVSGATTAGTLENLDWNLAADVRAVFIVIGANDGLRGLPLGESEKNIAAIIGAVKKSGAEAILAGMKIPPNYGEDYTRRFEEMYPRLARHYGIKLLPFLLEGVAGNRRYNLEDGIHPNAAGQKIIAENVAAFLDREKILK